jgi:putative phosphoesterase
VRTVPQIATMMRTRMDQVAIAIGRGPTRVAIISDSHGRPHSDAYSLLEREHPAAILHAGDIGRLDLLDELAHIAPIHAVRGNIDGHDAQTPDRRLIDIVRQGRCEIRILLTHIGVAQLRLRREVRQLAHEQRAGVVVCGHSHLPLLTNDGEITVFNPGSIGPRRFRLPTTFGVLDVALDSFALRHVDCDTGGTWRPPEPM